MVSAFGGGIDEPTDGTDRPQFESTDTLKAARFLKFVTILKLLRKIFKNILHFQSKFLTLKYELRTEFFRHNFCF